MAVQHGDLVRELFCGLRPGVPHVGVWGDESPGRKSMKCTPNSIVALLVSPFGQCCGMTRDVWALTRATAASFVEALEVIARGVGTLQSLKLVVGEFDAEGGEGVVDLRGRVGTDNRGRHHGVVVQPGQGDRGAGNAASRGDLADGIDNGAVGIGCPVGVEPVGDRVRPRTIGGRGLPRAGQPSACQRLHTIVPTPSSAHSGSISRSSSRARRL